MNRQRQPVTYRPLDMQNTLSEGLLNVTRPDGELQAKVASAMFRLADVAGGMADAKAQRQGLAAGARVGLDGAPQPTILSTTNAPAQSGNVSAAYSGDLDQETGVWLAQKLQSDFKLTPAQAAGVSANLAFESGNFKQLQEVKPLVPGSRGGFGLGAMD
ncbi:MAG: hypothetical protein U5K75_00130 [Ahrensia sp.]|nr:hypothetical protein [Ahrensia sp.]